MGDPTAPEALIWIVPVPDTVPPRVNRPAAVLVLPRLRIVAAVEPDAKVIALLSVSAPIVQLMVAVPEPAAMLMALPRVETLVDPPLMVVSVVPGVIVMRPVPRSLVVL